MSLRPARLLHEYRGSVIVTPPAVEPVTLAEVTALLLIDGNGDDALLADMIAEAREFIEHISGLAMITQVWRLSLDQWPMTRGAWWDGVRETAISELTGSHASLHLPIWPLQAVNSVTVFNAAGTSSAVDVAATFDADTYQRPGRLTLRNGATWPIALRDSNAIQIQYSAGYGGSGANVPAPLRRAVKQMVSHMYAHRGDGCDAGDAYADSGAAAIVGRYKVIKI